MRLNGAELMDRWGGNSEDECFELMQQAVDCGVDMISVTVGWQEAPESSIGRDIAPGHWNYLAGPGEEDVPDTLIAFGNRLPDPVMANECIGNGEFDFWEVCRPLLADPELVHKAAEDRLDEVRRCVGSLNCLSRLFRDLPYTCTMNPALGHEVEPEYQVTPAAVKKKIMVVGAGPAGLECAITAAKRGHEVVVYEKGDRLGGNLRRLREQRPRAGGRPDEHRAALRGDDEKARDRDEAGHRGDAQTHAQRAAPVRRLPWSRPARASTATACSTIEGARAAARRDGGRARARAAGREVVVIGGGKIGLVVAEALAHRGAQVTIVERDKRIAGDVMPSFKWRHATWVDELGIERVTQARVTKVTADGRARRAGARRRASPSRRTP